MTVAAKLWEDYSASDLRRLAARVGGMDRQTLRDWVHRFNTEGPDGLPRLEQSCRTA